MYTLAHGHFADFDNVPNPATLDKSKLPSGALILALQAIGFYYALLLAAMYCSDHHIRFTMLSAHGALEHSSKTTLQRVFFRQMYIVMEYSVRLVPMGR
jgi:hypothetical protein